MNYVSTSSAVIEAQNLTKYFGDYPALRGIDLQINRGESVVIFGPNGAGKTTLLKILATIMRPSSGNLIIDGLNFKKDAEEIRRRIGVVTHDTFLYNNLTAYENLEFYRRMYGIPQERIRDAINRVGMAPRLHDRISTLSRGMQQRLSIARALLHQPGIMLLDEPETGLDQEALATLWAVVRGERETRRTVVLTTHSLERGFDLCDRLVIINRGKVVYEQSRNVLDLAGLKQAYQECTKVKK